MYDEIIKRINDEKLPNQDFLEPDKIIRRPPTVKPKPVSDLDVIAVETKELEAPVITVKKEDVKKALDKRVDKLKTVHSVLKKNNNRSRVREQTRKKEVVELW